MNEQHTEEDILSLLEQLVCISDEFEGQQMIDLSNVDVCATDVDDGNNYSPTDITDDDFNKGITDVKNFIDNIPFTEDDAKDLIEKINSSDFEIPKNASDFIETIGLKDIFDSSYKAGNFAIIEFADKNNLYPAEEYQLYVNPGDKLTSDTIIGTCIQEEKWKPIKSIFSKGEVLAMEDDPSTFKRLFPNHCDRHIIVKDFEMDTDVTFDVSIFEEISGDFTKREEYFQLFKDVLNYSVLPTIIYKNRNLLDYINIIADDRTDLQIFDEWQEHVNKTIENFVKDKRIQIKEDRIKKTGGDGSKTKKLGEENIELQKLFIDGEHTWELKLNGMIDLYQNYATNTREWFKKEENVIEELIETVGNVSIFEDGTGLNNYHDCKNLGVTYYLDLLGRVPSDYDSDLTNELYELISDIIANRNRFEQHSLEEIIYWLNKTEQKEKILPNSFDDDVVTILDNEFKDTVKFIDVYNWLLDNKREKATNEACKRIANVYIYFRKNKQNEEYDYSEIYKKGKSEYDAINNYYSSNKEKRYKTKYSQSSEGVSDKGLQETIEIDIQNNGTQYYDFLPESFEKNIEYYKLTMLEKYRLDEFWNKVISEYKKGFTIDNLIEKLEINVKNDYAEWPSPIVINIENQAYTYYFFDNIDAWKNLNSLPDDPSLGDIPEDLEKVTLPEDPSTLGDIDPNGNDDDIPLKDYGKTHAQLTSYKYWLKYFGIATVCSLPYFAPSGINIAGVPLWLPAIFIPIFPLFIKILDLLIVIGLSVRGISIQPIFLFINLSNQDLCALLPVVVALKKVKQIFDDQMNKLEQLPAEYAQKFINKIIGDSEKLIRENRNLEVQIGNLESINFPGMERAKRQIEAEVEHISPRQHNYRKEDLMRIVDNSK